MGAPKCHKYLLQFSISASDKSQLRTRGGQTSFLPRTHSNLSTPLCYPQVIRSTLVQSGGDWQGSIFWSNSLYRRTDLFSHARQCKLIVIGLAMGNRFEGGKYLSTLAAAEPRSNLFATPFPSLRLSGRWKLSLAYYWIVGNSVTLILARAHFETWTRQWSFCGVFS